MQMKLKYLLIFVFLFAVYSVDVFSQEASWWEPEEPIPGDLLTVFYDTNVGTLPTNAQNVKLHWGMNETGSGNWIEPPSSIWPPGTVPWGDGHAVQSPMISQGGGIWSVDIQTNDTTYTIHYVITDGTNWDNNNNANWNIILEEPPPPVYTYHRFNYDTRSAFATYGLNDINNISVAGTFNSWSSSANLMTGPDERGVYTAEILIPVGANDYKFVINGNIWTGDPDNHLNDGSTYMNSRVITIQDTLPYFTQIQPVENSIVEPGETVEISAIVRVADGGLGIMGEPTVRDYGTVLDVNYNPATGELTSSLPNIVEGMHEIVFTVTDSLGNTGEFRQLISAVLPGTGFFAIDTENDDIGGGDYTYPVGGNSADLLGFSLTESANGDSIDFNISLISLTDLTRVVMQICTETDGFYFDSPLIENETSTSDWNGNGVQICLADPSSPTFDPSVHNIMLIRRDPVEFGSEVGVDAGNIDFQFSLSVTDLETVLGSYNRGWYFGAYSFIQTVSGSPGYAWEVDEAHGGIGEDFDPDIFDALFMDDRELQKTILSNYSGNRRCTLDNTGRGFVLVDPEDIGPNIGSGGPVINIFTRGAPTIIPEHTITGEADLAGIVDLSLFQAVSDTVIEHILTNITGTFIYDMTLLEGANTIWAEAEESGETGISPAIVYELYVEHAPEAVISTSYNTGTITLDASSSADPDGQPIDFLWTADINNPEQITLVNSDEAVCTFDEPSTIGEYYVNLTLTDPDSNVTHARTLATVYADSVHPFEWNESVQWVKDAIIYEIFPRSYSPSHQLSAISDDMDRIATIGYTAIWLMPIYPGPSDHGYAITDYYGIEEDYGTPEDFAELAETAHSYGIKIILDQVLNHSSVEHPFMQDAIEFDEYSHYYDYYDRDASGNYTYYYDWLSLPNMNYDNPDVWHYFIEMCKWWVTEYDVDGFRCDVAWGVQQRNPDFWIEWRDELKKIKPEIFLLAEASGTDFTFYDYRFDSAYDWNLHHEGIVNFQNMFPGPPSLNGLTNVITNYGFPYPQYHYPFRFMENHDEERYISYNTPDETKLAASLLMTIPGIPMIYAGQEIGTTSMRGQINWGTDPYDVAEHYEHIIQVRNLFPAIRSDDLIRLGNTQFSTVYSIGRYLPNEDPVISVMNFASWSQVVTITIPTSDWNIHPDTLYCLNEFIGGSHVWMTGSQLATITTSIDAKKSRIYAITDSVVTLESKEIDYQPGRFALNQNYPNPFNPDCVIRFEIPSPMKVKLTVYNVLGQKVRLLEDAVLSAGVHTVRWDGKNDDGGDLSSGLYFYRMQTEDFNKTMKMILLK